MKTIAHYRKEHKAMHERVEHYRREHKAMHERVEQIEGELAPLRAELDTSKADVVRLANHVVAADLQIGERDRAIAAGQERLNLLRDTVTKLTTRIDEQRRDLDRATRRAEDLEQERDAWKAQAEAAQPEIVELKANIAELASLLAKVDDRMKRKEREQASALLNRRALAGAMPATNRR